MNDLIIIGNISARPTSTITSAGAKVVNVAVTIEDGFGESPKSTHLKLDAWEKKATIAETLQPGQTCVFTCKTRVKTYTDANGQKRKALQPTIQEINVLNPGVRMASKQDARYLGHLTSHPVREGRRVRFSIKIDDARKEAEYMDCIAFEPLASTVEKHTTSGTQVIVSGRFEIEQYLTKDGKTGDSIRLLLDKNGLVIGWPERGGQSSRASVDFDELEPLTPLRPVAKVTVSPVVSTPVPRIAQAPITQVVSIEDDIDIDALFDTSKPAPQELILSTPINDTDDWLDMPF